MTHLLPAKRLPKFTLAPVKQCLGMSVPCNVYCILYSTVLTTIDTVDNTNLPILFSRSIALLFTIAIFWIVLTFSVKMFII